MLNEAMDFIILSSQLHQLSQNIHRKSKTLLNKKSSQYDACCIAHLSLLINVPGERDSIIGDFLQVPNSVEALFVISFIEKSISERRSTITLLKPIAIL